MILRILAVPLLIFAVAAAIVVLSVHPDSMPMTQTAMPTTCEATSGAGVSGVLPDSASGRAIVQIMPAEPYGAVYLDAVRQRLGLPLHGAPITGSQVTAFSAVMRYARADRDGRFVCRPLSPGRYIAVATTTRFGGSVAVNVADFDMGAQHGLATIMHDRFRPLQDLP